MGKPLYVSTKYYDHSEGLSACFRQHGAKSHCNMLHGYALAIKLTFEADTLDANSWVVDFGSLKPIKAWLKETFDHKLLVAHDDPMKDELCSLSGLGLADVLVVPATGCEAFAEMVYFYVLQWLKKTYPEGIRLRSVEVREHGANSAIFEWTE